uniref:Putative secreted salivary protein n=1 Tax=Ixodes scapularis TaxID=6945 RepID=Q4PMP4_IXOSC|nr:putative secreted salivary protein [Ixodes scapularis]
MKAILAVTCVFSAVVLISALSEEKCRAPHASSICATGTTPKTTYYFNNGTDQCESEFGCASGPYDFPTLEKCKENCPYGIYASSS